MGNTNTNASKVTAAVAAAFLASPGIFSGQQGVVATTTIPTTIPPQNTFFDKNTYDNLVDYNKQLQKTECSLMNSLWGNCGTTVLNNLKETTRKALGKINEAQPYMKELFGTLGVINIIRGDPVFLTYYNQSKMEEIKKLASDTTANLLSGLGNRYNQSKIVTNVMKVIKNEKNQLTAQYNILETKYY